MSPHVVDRLSAYLDHELPVAEATLVREHLAGCEACAERLAHLAAVDLGVRDLTVVAPAGYFDSFAARVRARVLAGARPRARFRVPAWSWAVAAALLLAVIVPRLPMGSSGPAPLPAQKTAATAGPPRSVPARPDAGAPADAAEPDRLRELAYSEPPAEAGARAKKELPRGGALASNEDAPPRLAAAPPFASAPPPQATPAAPTTAPPAAQTRTAQAFPAAPAPVPAPATAPAAKATGFAEGKTDVVSEEAHVAAADAVGRDEARAQVAAAERSDLEKDKRQNEGAPGAKPQAAPAGVGRPEEALKLRRASGERATPAPGASAAAEYGALEAEAHKSPEIPLAQRREGWRSFAVRHPDDPRADEARVRVVALGVDLARQTGDEADRALARKDAADYLARPDATQKKRVRALLEDLKR